MRRPFCWLGGIVITFTIVIGWTAPASAHAQLESTQPDPSAVLSTSPQQVVLHFGEPVEVDFGSIRVIGPDGGRVDEGGTHHPQGDSHAVAVSLRVHLPRGTFIVAWRVVSADSHPVHGAFIFSVGTASGAPKANALANSLSSARGSAVVGTIFGLVRFAAFTSLVLLVGMAVVITVAWPAGGATGRIRRLMMASWVVLFVCTVAGVAVQGIYASSLPLTDIVRPTLFNGVLHTRFGEVEILRAALLVAVLPLLLSIRRPASGGAGRPASGAVAGRLSTVLSTVLGPVAGLGLLVTPGLAGHASTGGDPGLGIALDVLHLAAVSVWIGGLAVLAAVLLPGLPEGSRPDDVRSLAMKFSAYAFAAVFVVVATGVVQSIRQVGSFYALFHTTYGIALSIKVGFVVLLLALAAVSRRLVLGGWVGPRMAHPIRTMRAHVESPSLVAASALTGRDSRVAMGADNDLAGSGEHASGASGAVATVEGHRRVPGLRTSVCAELAIMLVVLAVTALLVNAVPAKQAANQPFSQSFNVLSLQVNAIVAPAKTGPGNQVHFYVLGRQGEAVAIPELDAAISLASQGIGPLAIPLVVASPGHFRADNVDIPLAGNWSLRLTVRTTPIDEEVLYATLPVH
jgi:copper transport protein